MKVPICGICCGFRIKEGGKNSDYAVMDILQAGDKNYDSSLISVYIDQIDIIEKLLQTYSDGQLRWFEGYCIQIPQGRDLIWLLQDLFTFSSSELEVIT